MKASLYRFWGEGEQLLYVGASRNPFARQNGHWIDKDMTLVRKITLEWFDSYQEVCKEEVAAIKAERPLWNKVHNESRYVTNTPEREWQGPPAPLRRWGAGEMSEFEGLEIDLAMENIPAANLRLGDIVYIPARRNMATRWIEAHGAYVVRI